MERNRIRRLQRPWSEFNIYRLPYEQDVRFLKYESLSVSSANPTLDATISSSPILPTLVGYGGPLLLLSLRHPKALCDTGEARPTATKSRILSSISTTVLALYGPVLRSGREYKEGSWE